MLGVHVHVRVSKGILLATFLIALVVLSALGAAHFRAARVSLGCKEVHTSRDASACRRHYPKTDAIMTMHVGDVTYSRLHVDEISERSTDDMLREAGAIAYHLFRGGMAAFGMARIALSMMCSQPQDSGQVVLCNMMQLTFETIEDEFVAPLPSIVAGTITL